MSVTAIITEEGRRKRSRRRVERHKDEGSKKNLKLSVCGYAEEGKFLLLWFVLWTPESRLRS